MSSLLLYGIYASGWLLAMAKAFTLLRTTSSLGTRDRMLLWVVYCVPLGKLMYFHFEALIGFKFVFLFFSLFIVAVLLPKVMGHTKSVYFGVFAGLMAFPALSLVVRGEWDGLLLYEVDGQKDSLLARLGSLGVLVVFALFVWDFVRRNGYVEILESFMQGVICAAIVGVLIFVGVYAGIVTVDDLLPVSADTHVVDLIYRFNPGTNVNEFGVLAAYALFLYGVVSSPKHLPRRAAALLLLFFALFFSLTRAAWLAYVAAIVVVSLFGAKRRLGMLALLAVAVVFVFVVYSIDESLAELVASRLEFQGGASGEDRIEKFETAFADPLSSPLTLLFGNGWATNLYLHSVPLQLVFEVGLVGFTFALIALAYMSGALVSRRNTLPPELFTALLGCLVVMVVASCFHHTLYHMQTWFVVGLVLAAISTKQERVYVAEEVRALAHSG